MSSTTSLYRSALRQMHLRSIHERSKRSPAILLHLRKIFEQHKAVATGSDKARVLERDAVNLVDYLKATRLHKGLLERYNSADGMTTEERATKSAAMVGLDMPRAFDPDRAPTMEYGRGKGGDKAEEEPKVPGGTLQNFIPEGR